MVVLICISLGAADGPAILPANAPAAFSQLVFPPGQTQVVVPIEEAGHSLYIKDVSSNGKPVGYFIIDTGANVTMLDTEFVRSLKLELLHPEDAAAESPTYKIASIKVGGLEMRHHLIIGQRLSAVRTHSGISEMGILGSDFLAKTPFMLDAHGGTITFYDRAAFVPPADVKPIPIQLPDVSRSGADFDKANPDAASPIVDIHINDFATSAVLDTGEPGDLILLPSLTRGHPETVDLTRGRRAINFLMAQAEARNGTVAGLTFLGHRTDHPDAAAILHAQAQSDRAGFPTGCSAIVGESILRGDRRNSWKMRPSWRMIRAA
jgi:predicted aspartyl protease